MAGREHVNLNNARRDDQRMVMEQIVEDDECPFCPENLTTYHHEPVVRYGKNWLITPNQWPYEFTRLHLLAIATTHIETVSELPEGSFAELQEHLRWATFYYEIASGGLAMRFGDIGRNGATVNHLHAHIIVPEDDKPDDAKVRFKIS